MKPVILTMTLLLAACTPSLEPLYTEQDKTFDPALLGVWRDAEKGKDYFVATRSAGSAYRILQTDGGGTAVFTARLVELNGARFVDLYPDKPAVPNGFYGGHLIRAHTFGQIWLHGNQLRIALLDPDWFKTEAAKSAALTLTAADEDLLLLAPTAQLRQFAARHAGTAAFAANSDWVREP